MAPSSRLRRFVPLALAVMVAACGYLMLAQRADAASTPSSSVPATINPNDWGGTTPVPGFRLTPARAIAIAASSPRVRHELIGRMGLRAGAFPLSGGHWDVTWIANCDARCVELGRIDMANQIVDVDVSDASGRIVHVWTGLQAQTEIARGEASYVGKALDSPFIWIPLCLLFVLPFVDPRRPFRLLHLDLLVLLGFSVSQVFFSGGDLGASIPLVYPVLAYLFVRMLLAGFRPRKTSQLLIPFARNRWLLLGIVVLVAFRIGLNIADSNVLDVGAAGSVGADQIIHGHQLYNGALGQQIQGGDTYGPVNYLAYVPFRLALHSNDAFDSAAVHGAAIFFDLLTLIGLFLLGRQLRTGREGKTMGLALAYAWVAYPYSAFALSENTNDSLIAALLVFTMVVLLSPWRRGIVLALASLAKFVPLALVPLIATGKGPRSLRAWLLFGVAFGVTALVSVLPVVPPGSLHQFYSSTLGAQLHRQSPLSIWGQVPSLKVVKDLLEVATVALAILVAFRPTVRSRAQVAALGAALIIAIEVCVSYWYYSYVVWFAPLVLVALFSQHRLASRSPEHAVEIAAVAEDPVLAVAGPVS